MYITKSNPAFPSAYINRVKAKGEFLTAYEMGSLRLQDPSGGLLQQLWTATSDGFNIWVESATQSKVLLVRDFSITEIDLAFDQNMFPFICYTAFGITKFYWYDPVAQQFKISQIQELAISPRCTLDDKRQFNIGNSDIIFMYVDLLLGYLCYRAQRDRYNIVYFLEPVSRNDRVRCINFAGNLRLQWTLDDFTPVVAYNANKGLANYARPISITGAFLT